MHELDMRKLVMPGHVERPEVSGFKVVHYEPELSVVRYTIDGETPEITDYLSDRVFKITDGVGKLFTTTGYVNLHQGTETGVDRGNPYVIKGCLSLFVEASPWVTDGFVAFNGEELPAPNKRELKKILGQTLSQKAMQRLVETVPMERYLRIFALMDESSRLEDN
jgi:hypothetical protein